jgi:hypothetical protein
MSVTLELTELEADYVTQALLHELTVTELILCRITGAVEPEVFNTAATKAALLDGLIERIMSE